MKFVIRICWRRMFQGFACLSLAALGLGDAKRALAMEIGQNLEFGAHWAGDFTHTDLVKETYFRTMSTATGSEVNDIPIPTHPDNLWPTQVPFSYDGAEYRIRLYFFEGSVYAPQNGYTLLMEGIGEVRTGGGLQGGTITHDGVGVKSVTINRSSTVGIGWLDVYQSDPSDNLRLRLIHPGQNPDELLHTKMIEVASHAAALRSVHYVNIDSPEGGGVVEWEDRVPANTPISVSGAGHSWESFIELCNASSSDAWVCLPHAANDGYVAGLAELLNDTLDPELRVYVEYSNETWNWAYPWITHMAWASAQAVALGYEYGDSNPDVNTFQQCHWYMARRTGEIIDIFETEFGSEFEDRIISVMAGHQANSSVLTTRMAWMNDASANPSGNMVDAIAIAGYFGENYFTEPAPDTDAIIANVRDGLENTLPGHLEAHKVLADFYGLDFVLYEGGQHVTAQSGNTNLHDSRSDPRWYDIYADALALYEANGVSLFMNYSMVLDAAETSMFGMLENVYSFPDGNSATDPIPGEHRWNAIMDFINNGGSGGPGGGGDPDPAAITVHAEEVASAPIIDGVLSDAAWSNAYPVTKDASGTNDNTLSFDVVWDSQYLYVAATVLDSELVSDSDQPYDDDSVEIYIDGNNNGATAYDLLDNQIVKGYNRSDIFVSGSLSGFPHAWAPIAGGYTIEVAIPWSGIGVHNPMVGEIIGFDIGLNDDDGSGREGKLIWAGDDQNWRSTEFFGDLELVAAGDGGVTENPDAGGGGGSGGGSGEEGWTLFEETDPNWRLFGTTGVSTSVSHSNGSAVFANFEGDISIGFDGSMIRVYGPRFSWYGVGKVWIDGVEVADYDANSTSGSQYQQLIFESSDLGPGPHAITIEAPADVPVAVDFIEIFEGAPTAPARGHALDEYEKSGIDPTRFESNIQNFESQDASSFPDAGSVLFVGSSSIVGYHQYLESDYAPIPTLGRGFGGSTMRDLAYYADRVVYPYAPSAIVVYEGDNDMGEVSPLGFVEEVMRFVEGVRTELPGMPIYLLSIKPSPSRWPVWDKMQEANTLLQLYADTGADLQYIDIATPMLGSDGMPLPHIFQSDELHMNRDGYDIWTSVIRPILLSDLGFPPDLPEGTLKTLQSSPDQTHSGYNGNAFDLTNNSTTDTFTLTGEMRLNLGPNSGIVVDAWVRNGTVLDNVAGPSTGWTHFGTATVDGNGWLGSGGVLTPVNFGNTLEIAPGETVGILFTADGNQIGYASGSFPSAEGDLSFTPVYGLGTTNAVAPNSTFDPATGIQTYGPTRSFIGEIDFVAPEEIVDPPSGGTISDTLVSAPDQTHAGYNGNAFDLVNNSTDTTLTLDGTFRMNLGPNSGIVVDAWIRNGTVLGNVNGAGQTGWTHFGTATVDGNGWLGSGGTLTPVDFGNTAEIAPGETLGFLFTANGNQIGYASGSFPATQGDLSFVPVYGLGGGSSVAPNSTFDPATGIETYGPTRTFMGEIDFSIPEPPPVILNDTLVSAPDQTHAGYNGNAFDLVNNSTDTTLTLDGTFRMNLGPNSGIVVDAWIRNGTVLGNVNGSGQTGWTHFGTATVDGNGWLGSGGTLTPVDFGNTAEIAPGETLGFLFTANGNQIGYASGSFPATQGDLSFVPVYGLGGGSSVAPNSTFDPATGIETYGPTRTFMGEIDFSYEGEDTSGGSGDMTPQLLAVSATDNFQGLNGNAFDLINLSSENAIELSGLFRMNLSSNTGIPVDAWIRQDSVVGNVATVAGGHSGWTHYGRVVVNGNGYASASGSLTDVDFGTAIEIGPGGTLGFLFTTASNVGYINSDVPANQGSLQISQQYGIGFDNVVQPDDTFDPSTGVQVFGPVRSFIGEIEFVELDGPGSGSGGGSDATVVEEDDSNWAAAGTVIEIADVNDSGGGSVQLFDGASLTLNFEGSRVRVYGSTDTWFGVATIELDGAVAGTFDAQASRAYQVEYFDSGDIGQGNHTITVMAPAEGSIYFDYLEIEGDPVSVGGPGYDGGSGSGSGTPGYSVLAIDQVDNWQNFNGNAFDLVNHSTTESIRLNGIFRMNLSAAGSIDLELWTREGTALNNVAGSSTGWTQAGTASVSGNGYASASGSLTEVDFEQAIEIGPGETLGVLVSTSGHIGYISGDLGVTEGDLELVPLYSFTGSGFDPALGPPDVYGPSRTFIGEIEFMNRSGSAVSGISYVIPVEENDPDWSTSGNVIDIEDPENSGGFSWQLFDSASVSYTFEGKRALIYGTTNDWYGVGSVYVDGAQLLGTFDAYSENKAYQVLLFDTGDLGQGEHTVQIVAPAGGSVFIDYIEILSDVPAGGGGGSVFVPTPKPPRMGVGLTLSERGNMWTDAAKIARPWQQPNLGAELTAAEVDAEGWPLVDASTVLMDYRPVPEWAGSIDDPLEFRVDVSGTYKCSFEGTADVSILEGDASIENFHYVPGLNRSTFDLVVNEPGPHHGLVILNFINTQRDMHAAVGTGFRNFKAWVPGYEDSDQNFTREFYEAATAANIEVFRYMTFNYIWSQSAGVGEAIFPDVIEWSERSLPSDATQQVFPALGRVNRAAWEYTIEISNRTKVNPWITIPISASEDYLVQLATLFRDNLDPELELYIEVGNEIWGFNYAGWDYNVAEASALGLNPRQNLARHVADLSEAFESVYGSDSINTRVFPVLCHWLIRPTEYTEMLQYIDDNYGPPSEVITAIASAPYFNGRNGDTSTVDAVLDNFLNSIEANRPRRIALQQIADQWGVKHFTYEGGSDTGGGDTTNIENLITAERSAAMESLMTYDLKDTFFDLGGELFVSLALSSGYNRFGSWGYIEDLDVLDTPKMSAIIGLVGEGSLPAMPGDLNGDDVVDNADMAVMRGALRTKVGDPGYMEEADLDGDGEITLYDYRMLIMMRNK